MWRVTCLAVLLVTSQARAELVSGVPRIIDGDTFEIGPTTIRLSGIDAPEVAQPGGVDAIGALAALVEAKETRCEGSQRDAYNRLIATCNAGEGDVGAALVSHGHAWAYTKYSPAYSDLQQTARSSHEGIWRGTPEPPWDFRAKRWKAAEQNAPEGCPIKGNITRHSQRIYHAPWSPWYRKTRVDARKGERWFCSEREALEAGWRAPYWR